MFETCKRERSNDNAKDEQNTIGLEVSNVESLKTDTLSVETLNFWLCKFVQKVRLPYLLRINILFAVAVILFFIIWLFKILYFDWLTSGP